MRKGNGLHNDIEKVINGRRFDTAKAILIARIQSGGVGALGLMDFQSFEEALYKTPKSDRFFLAGRGGALTKWGRPSPCRDGSVSGEGLHEVTFDEAYSWAEANQCFVDLDYWFPDRITEA